MNPEMPAWLLDQTLTAEQGLRAVTLDAAWALGDEARRGHLAPGTFGDVTILSGDVTNPPPGRDPGHGRRRDHRRRDPRLLPRSEVCSQLDD
jgi:imidazolonepropionase-like amidohydrolase